MMVWVILDIMKTAIYLPMHDSSIYDCYAIAITDSQHKGIAVIHLPDERKKELKFSFY